MLKRTPGFCGRVAIWLLGVILEHKHTEVTRKLTREIATVLQTAIKTTKCCLYVSACVHNGLFQPKGPTVMSF